MGLQNLRERAGRWVESERIQRIIIALIIINAVTLGLETSSRVMEAVGGLLKLIDRTLLGVFVAEIVLTMIAMNRFSIVNVAIRMNGTKKAQAQG